MAAIRRRLLLQAAWSGLLAGLAVPFGSRPAGAEALLTGVFSRPASARAVGKRVLAAYPAFADPRNLVDGLVGRHPGLEGLLGTGDEAGLGQALGQAVREDFARGDTVLVDGWLLSRTEAALCALACTV
ncbi:MAG: hypothetical protein KDG89_06330 [Geminicoccaceae bacterium]|nr:hypothetical protein [Geminicoccaceae bacterium]